MINEIEQVAGVFMALAGMITVSVGAVPAISTFFCDRSLKGPAVTLLAGFGLAGAGGALLTDEENRERHHRVYEVAQLLQERAVPVSVAQKMSDKVVEFCTTSFGKNCPTPTADSIASVLVQMRDKVDHYPAIPNRGAVKANFDDLVRGFSDLLSPLPSKDFEPPKLPDYKSLKVTLGYGRIDLGHQPKAG